VLRQHSFPVDLAAFHEENLDPLQLLAIGHERRANRPKANAHVLREIFSTVSDVGVFRELAEGLLQVLDYAIRDFGSELFFDVHGDALQAIARCRSETVGKAHPRFLPGFLR
jgi:hypothetical protein